jgi:hypothetical protein
MATLAEMINANPSKVQEFLDMARASEEEAARKALETQAKTGQETLEKIKQSESIPPEYANKRAKAVAKLAKAAIGEGSKEVISDLPQISGRMAQGLKKAKEAAAGSVSENVISDLPFLKEETADAIKNKPALPPSKTFGEQFYGDAAPSSLSQASDISTPTVSAIEEANPSILERFISKDKLQLAKQNMSALSKSQLGKIISASLKNAAGGPILPSDPLENTPYDIDKIKSFGKLPTRQDLTDSVLRQAFYPTPKGASVPEMDKAFLDDLYAKPEIPDLKQSSSKYDNAELLAQDLQRLSQKQDGKSLAAIASEEEKKSLAPAARVISAGEPTASDAKSLARQTELTPSIGQDSAKQIADYESFLDKFKAYREQEKEDIRNINLQEAVDALFSGRAGIKPQTERYEKLREQTRKDKEKEFAVSEESDSRDPNSLLSRQWRDAATSAGITLKGNETAYVLKQTLPFLQKRVENEENRKTREQLFEFKKTQEAKEYDEKKQAAIEKEAIKLGENKEYLEQQSALDEMESAEQKIAGFIKEPSFSLDTYDKKTFKKDLPGASVPGLGRVSFYGSNARELNAAFEGVLNRAIRSFAGKAVTRNELERIKTQYEGGKFANEKDFLQAFADVKKSIKRGLANTERTYSPKALDVLEERGKRLVSRESSIKKEQLNSKIEAAAKEAGISYEKMEQYLRQTGQIK